MYFPLPSPLIEFIILSVTCREDSYGYEISQSVKLISDIKESTLYPILKKMVTAGYVTTYTKEYQGRIRKYYTITPDGNAHLSFLREQWASYKQMIDRITAARTEGLQWEKSPETGGNEND